MRPSHRRNLWDWARDWDWDWDETDQQRFRGNSPAVACRRPAGMPPAAGRCNKPEGAGNSPVAVVHG